MFMAVITFILFRKKKTKEIDLDHLADTEYQLRDENKQLKGIVRWLKERSQEKEAAELTTGKRSSFLALGKTKRTEFNPERVDVRSGTFSQDNPGAIVAAQEKV